MNQSHHRLTKLAALASVMGLMACGGGGSESAPSNTASSVPNQSMNQYGSTNPQANEANQPTDSRAQNSTSSSENSTARDTYGHDAGATSSDQGQGYSNAPSTMGTSSTQPNATQGTYGAPYGSSGTSTGSYPSGSSQSGSTYRGDTTSGDRSNSASGSGSGSGSGYGQNYGNGTNSSSDTMGSNSSASGASGAAMSESQLDGALQAINQGEIQAAQLAQNKSSSPAVKRFAQHMVTEHRDMENKANAAFSRAQVTATDSSESRQLKSEGQNQLSSLQGQSGHDFDVAYVDAQVKGHNQALELLDRALPNVKHADLKSALQAARSRVEEHLREAEQLQQQLQMGNTNTQGGTSPNHSNQNNPNGSMEH